jgi:hypothetical protein
MTERHRILLWWGYQGSFLEAIAFGLVAGLVTLVAVSIFQGDFALVVIALGMVALFALQIGFFRFRSRRDPILNAPAVAMPGTEDASVPRWLLALMAALFAVTFTPIVAFNLILLGLDYRAGSFWIVAAIIVALVEFAGFAFVRHRTRRHIDG